MDAGAVRPSTRASTVEFSPLRMPTTTPGADCLGVLADVVIKSEEEEEGEHGLTCSESLSTSTVPMTPQLEAKGPTQQTLVEQAPDPVEALASLVQEHKYVQPVQPPPPIPPPLEPPPLDLNPPALSKKRKRKSKNKVQGRALAFTSFDGPAPASSEQPLRTVDPPLAGPPLQVNDNKGTWPPYYLPEKYHKMRADMMPDSFYLTESKEWILSMLKIQVHHNDCANGLVNKLIGEKKQLQADSNMLKAEVQRLQKENTSMKKELQLYEDRVSDIHAAIYPFIATGNIPNHHNY